MVNNYTAGSAASPASATAEIPVSAEPAKIAGREILYQRLYTSSKCSTAVQAALRQFQEGWTLAQQWLHPSHSARYTYDLSTHACCEVGYGRIAFIDDAASQTYKQDHLQHVLFPKLLAGVFGQEAAGNDQERFRQFIQAKMGNVPKWQKFLGKVQAGTFRSAQAKQAKIEHNIYQASPQGRLEAKKSERVALQQQDRQQITVTNFSGVDLHLLLAALADGQKTPASSIPMQQFKSQLSTFIQQVIAGKATGNDLAGVSAWKKINDVSDAWLEIGCKPANNPFEQPPSTFQQFRNCFLELMQQREDRVKRIEALHQEISALERELNSAPVRSSAPASSANLRTNPSFIPASRSAPAAGGSRWSLAVQRVRDLFMVVWQWVQWFWAQRR